MHRPHVFLLTALFITLRALSVNATPQLTGGTSGDSTVAWSREEDIRFVYATPLIDDSQATAGDPKTPSAYQTALIIGTKEGLEALDGESGVTLWRRSDLKRVEGNTILLLRRTEQAFLDTGREVMAISLRTGESLWSSRSLPLKDIRLYVPIPGHARMLVVGQDSSGTRTVLNVGMANGVVSWRRRNLWRRDPPCGGALPRVQRSGAYQPPITDTDSTLIVWLTDEGPVRLNLATGEPLWVASELAKYGVPSPLGGCLPKPVPRWVLYGGTVYTPVGSRNWDAGGLLAAIDAHSGALRWKVEAVGGLGAITIADSSSLLIQGWDDEGSSFLDRRAMDNGASLWTRPVAALRDASSTFSSASGEVFLVANSRVLAVSLRDGTRTARDTLTFGGGEVPVVFCNRSGMVVLASEQNLAAVDSSGVVQYRARFPNPVKESRRKVLGVLHTLGVIAAVASVPKAFSLDPSSQVEFQSLVAAVVGVEAEQRALAVETGLTNITERFAFFCSRLPGEDGPERWWLRQVGLRDGVDVARYPLRRMPSRLVLNQELGLMYALYQGSRLDAIRVAVQ